MLAMLAVKTSDMGEHGQACCRLIWAKAGLALSQASLEEGERLFGRSSCLLSRQLDLACSVMLGVCGRRDGLSAAGEEPCRDNDSAELALMQGIHHSLLQARGSKA